MKNISLFFLSICFSFSTLSAGNFQQVKSFVKYQKNVFTQEYENLILRKYNGQAHENEWLAKHDHLEGQLSAYHQINDYIQFLDDASRADLSK